MSEGKTASKKPAAPKTAEKAALPPVLIKHVVRELSEAPVPGNAIIGTEAEIGQYLSIWLSSGWSLKECFFLGMFDNRVRVMYILLKDKE